MDKFLMTTPLTGEYFTTVRLAVGGVCALAGFDVDAAEDFKVCVTESLLILKRNGFSRAQIEFTVGESLGCSLRGIEKGEMPDEALEEEISRALLCALIGDVRFITGEDGKVEGIQFEG